MPAPRHFTLDAQRFGLHIWAVSGKNGTSRPVGKAGGGSAPKGSKMSIEQFIDNEVKSNDVVLFMKGTPQFPQCGFSGQVGQILDNLGVVNQHHNVADAAAHLRNGIKPYSNWPTIPQLYVKGDFVGGCDIIREMFQAGELQQLFADKAVPVAASASAWHGHRASSALRVSKSSSRISLP